MPAGPRKPVERHNGRVYWPTRDVAVGFVDFDPPGRILGTQTFRGGGGCPHFTYTHFSGGQGFAFYLHTLSGRFLSKIEKNDFKFETFSALRVPFFLSNP